MHRIKSIYNYLILPTSLNADTARRELILKVLVLGFIVVSFVATFLAWRSLIFPNAQVPSTYWVIASLITLLFLLFIVSFFSIQRGFGNLVAIYILVVFYVGSTYTLFNYGTDVPESLLLYALTIIISGILINSRTALYTTCIIVLTLLIVLYLHNIQAVNPNLAWRIRNPDIYDYLIHTFTLGVICLVSWLFNRDNENALKRARKSELALRKQRDNLEKIVEQRTRQIYRFAEVGKFTAGLFHDLVNPLTLVSLNLNQLKKTNKPENISEISELVTRALNGTQRLELFIEATRRQIQNQSISKRFSVFYEINYALEFLQHRIKQKNIQIKLNCSSSLNIIGDPIKFNQIITNLISNAIDAYSIKSKQKEIDITVISDKKFIVIDIQDFGSGIKTAYLSKIFEPLFTTKKQNSGTGLGLSICKEFIEKDFHGQISVESIYHKGTKFRIRIPLRKS